MSKAIKIEDYGERTADLLDTVVARIHETFKETELPPEYLGPTLILALAQEAIKRVMPCHVLTQQIEKAYVIEGLHMLKQAVQEKKGETIAAP